MKKILYALLLTSFLAACAGDESAPSWFEYQGVNITECGPTVAANAINWAGGNTNRYTTRNMFPTPSWWTLANIYSTISRNGVHVAYKHKDDIDIIKKDNISGIFYVNRTHFINVDYVNGSWVVYDPLYGINVKSRNDIINMSWVNFIAVYS